MTEIFFNETFLRMLIFVSLFLDRFEVLIVAPRCFDHCVLDTLRQLPYHHSCHTESGEKERGKINNKNGIITSFSKNYNQYKKTSKEHYKNAKKPRFAKKYSLKILIPGEPPKIVNGGTTVSGGRIVLSSTSQQSLRIHDRD